MLCARKLPAEHEKFKSEYAVLAAGEAQVYWRNPPCRFSEQTRHMVDVLMVLVLGLHPIRAADSCSGKCLSWWHYVKTCLIKGDLISSENTASICSCDDLACASNKI